MMSFNRSADASLDKSNENVVDIMDVEPLPFSRKPIFHGEQQNYLNSRHTENVEFVRPEYVSKENSGSLRYLDIENTLIDPQLRLQMLMCREYKKYTNILLVAIFGREMLATHSLNGTGTSKPRLDVRKVNYIIGKYNSCYLF
jgi:BEN domain.